MKKQIPLYIIILTAAMLCLAGCTKTTTQSPNNNVHFELPSTDSMATPQTETTQGSLFPSFTTQPASEVPTDEQEPIGPQAPQGFINEYTYAGKPLIIYEVIDKGGNAAYSGAYSRYVYTNDQLTTLEKWTTSETGDQLLSTTDYEYDGRGYTRSVAERLPDATGNLYTYCLTESDNNTDGTVASKTITYFAADGSTVQQTSFEYDYDRYGNQILCTVTENGVIQKQTETVCTYDGSILVEQTETTILNPDTTGAKTSVLALTFDARGNITSRTEQDGALHYTVTYTYDSFDREISSRTTQPDGKVTEYTTTEYEDLGAGCTRVRVRLFTEDGSLYDTQVICYDAHGNSFLPENVN